MGICGAKKRNGEPCKARPMANGRCRIHGGLTPKGVASPHYKHGKFSDYLPERLVKIYDDVQADTEHRLLERNINVREMFLRESLAKIDQSPESAEVWQTLRKLWDELQIAYNNEQLAKVDGVMRQVDRLIDERMLYFHALHEIKDTLAQQRADKVAIANIEHKGENVISATELMTLMGMVFSTIQTIVTDKQQRIQIADAIDNIFTRQERTITISE